MNINVFIEKFSNQFEETSPDQFKPETNFRSDLDEWDSLTALAIIAMVDAEYNVVLKGSDIRESKTIEDIFNLVKSRS